MGPEYHYMYVPGRLRSPLSAPLVDPNTSPQTTAGL